MWSVPSTLTAALLLTAPLLLLLAGLAPTAWANRRPRTMAGLSGIELTEAELMLSIRASSGPSRSAPTSTRSP